MKTVTQARVKELLTYEPTSGLFRWAVKRRRINPGDVAGSMDKRGYVHISIDNHPYSAHRLAHLYMTGKMPIGPTDHRNGNKSDNSWENLRTATWEINAQNVREPTTRNTSRALGVCKPAPGKKKYKAAIQVQGKAIHLGYHETTEAAHQAYVLAKRAHHPGGTL